MKEISDIYLTEDINIVSKDGDILYSKEVDNEYVSLANELIEINNIIDSIDLNTLEQSEIESLKTKLKNIHIGIFELYNIVRDYYKERGTNIEDVFSPEMFKSALHLIFTSDEKIINKLNDIINEL